MSGVQALPARRGWHGSVRGRLAGATALLLTAFGVVVLGAVYLGMRFLPNYQIAAATGSTSALTPVTGGTAQLATPIAGTTGTAVTVTPVTTAPLGLVISSPGSVVSTLLMIGAVVLAATVALGAVAAWLLARRFLRPLEALARVSAAFGDGDLAHRAPSTGRDDEFGMVTHAFNAMLDRAERAMTINQRFAANASHELRSPLATTKTLLDVARQDPASVELGPLLAKLSAANARSIAIVEALLDLADADRADIEVDTVDVAAAVAAAVQEITAEAAGKGVTFHGHLARCEADANLSLVRLAVGNLLSNAVRHNTEGGTVEVETGTVLIDTVLTDTVLTDTVLTDTVLTDTRVTDAGLSDAGVTGTRVTGTGPRDGWARVRIRNTGPVVAPEIIQLLGEPFYRIRPRYRPAGQVDSHGLGLPIALAIAEALGGSLTLTANPEGGLTAELRLPPVVGNVASPRTFTEFGGYKACKSDGITPQTQCMLMRPQTEPNLWGTKPTNQAGLPFELGICCRRGLIRAETETVRLLQSDVFVRSTSF